MAMGEKPPLAAIDAPASGRMAVAEALTNLFAADIADWNSVKLSANWMAAAGQRGEDAALYATVKTVSETCIALDIAIPVGKDSMSMRTAWRDKSGNSFNVVSPVSLNVTSFAQVNDVRETLTPELKFGEGDTELVWFDFANGKRRLGGSALAQVYRQLGDETPDLDDVAAFKRGLDCVRRLARQKKLLAYHDVSDGGVLVTLLEMAFAAHCGLRVSLPNPSALSPLAVCFAEELGVVVQVKAEDAAAVLDAAADAGIAAYRVGLPRQGGDANVTVAVDDTVVLDETRFELQLMWASTSLAMQSLRDSPYVSRDTRQALVDVRDPGLKPVVNFEMPVASSEEKSGNTASSSKKALIAAILREQGVNSQTEMAAAFTQAGFECVDVHMTDLFEGRFDLKDARLLVACGGFSYGDVLGAGGGWAKSILFNEKLKAMFAAFFARPDTLSLGVCNGCQMMSQLRDIIPGAAHFPNFVRNASEQFEARLSEVAIDATPSVFLKGMEGSRLPIVVSHGEGRVEFASDAQKASAMQFVSAHFVNHYGKPTETYPFNPNGSASGATAFTSEDGRCLIMMPHPERSFRAAQLSWHPKEWAKFSPWLKLFLNAREWM
jgi:phosphoribosylformylglycinamidine synthase